MADGKNWLWRYSVAICRRPRLVVSVCFAVTFVCSLGLLRVKVVTNPDLIWVPPNSLANRQKEFFDAAFSPFFRVNQVFFVASEPQNGVDSADMIATQYLQRVMSVQRAIATANFTSNVNGQPANFDSLCFKPIEGEGCLVESPSQYWLNDPVLLAQDPSPSLTAACQTTDPFLASRSPCMDKIGTPVMRAVVFGDIGTNNEVVSPDPCGGGVPAAGALVLTFLLNNYEDADYQRLAKQWEKEVFLTVVEEARDLLENDVQAPMKVSYMAQRSVEDSLSVEAGENAWVLIVSYLLMFLYVSLILGQPCHPVRSRYSLALTGIVIVVASLGTAIGVLSLIGVGTTLIVWEVVPFLTLAIGVDNMVILSREFDRLASAPEFEQHVGTVYSPSRHDHHNAGDLLHSDGATAIGPTYTWAGGVPAGGGDGRLSSPRLEERMGAAVSKVAPSILGAAVCEAGAFFVGALTDIPALRQFCLVAATAVVVGFLLQVTWFMACLSLDARRVSQERLDVAPWATLDRLRKTRSKWPPPPAHLDPSLDNSAIGINAPLLGPNSGSSHLPVHYDQHQYKRNRKRPLQKSGGESGETASNTTIAGLVIDRPDSPEAYGGKRPSRYSAGEGDIAAGRISGSTIFDDNGNREHSDDVNNEPVDNDVGDQDDEFEDDDEADVYQYGYGNTMDPYEERLDRQRSLTAEFGTGDGANPALFSTQTARFFPHMRHSWGLDTDSGSKKRRRRWENGKISPGDYDSVTPDGIAGPGLADRDNRGGGVSVGGARGFTDVGGTCTKRGKKLESWFDSPQDYEVQSEASMMSEPSNQHERTDQSQSREHGNTAGVSSSRKRGPSNSTGASNNLNNADDDGKRLSERRTDDGYVSLTSRLGPRLVHRRGTGDEVLLGDGLEGVGGVGGVGDGDGGGAGGRESWLCGNSGLARFRDQLYEEGRSKGKKGNLAARVLDRYYLPALFSPGGKLLTLVVAAGLAVLGVFGLVGLEMGLEPQLAAPTDFYLQDYYDAQFTLGEAGPPAYIIFSDVDYFRAFNDSDVRQSFTGVSTGLAQLQRYVQVPIYSWFDTMVAWVNQRSTLAADCPAQIEITDEASFYSMVDTFLSIPIESQCCQSYGVCGAQFETDVAFEEAAQDRGFRRVQASRLRFNLQPLMSQRDYVNSYYYVKLITDKLADEIPERYEGQRKANHGVGNLAYPYSLYFVFYEQYAFIQGVALQNIALALAVVFLSIGVLSGFTIAWMVTTLVLGTTLGTVGLVWAWGELSTTPYGVSINAVSVCNLVMSLGLSVEFCLHVAVAFQSVPGSRQERAAAAMKSAGASVLTGITLTKLVGVSVLAIAPSLLFRVYYFRMYMATVFAGAFQGLALLPVLLSICGPKAPPNVSGSPHVPARSREASWILDKQQQESTTFFFPSPTGVASASERGGGYFDLRDGAPGGALGWNWGNERSHKGWEDSREFVETLEERVDGGGVEGMQRSVGSATGLSLPPTSFSDNGDLVQ